jgi:hypothetical protein
MCGSGFRDSACGVQQKPPHAARAIQSADLAYQRTARPQHRGASRSHSQAIQVMALIFLPHPKEQSERSGVRVNG